MTSAQLNTLGTEIQAYVSSANESRKNDALRLASTRQYFQSIDDLALGEVRAWRANPDDPKSRNKVAAFDSLELDAAADMATTDSNLKQQGNAVTALEASYGQVTYDSSQLQALVASLQTLAKRSSQTTQIELFATFAKAVVDDAKSGLNSSTLNPNGISNKTLE